MRHSRDAPAGGIGALHLAESYQPMDTPPRKLLLRALAGERTERPPIWLMRQAGRYLP
jgi:hypothetical protein